MKYHLTPQSSNSKTGKMPVSTTSADSCPSACPLQGNGCYAESGKLGIWWRRMKAYSTGLNAFCQRLEKIPPGTPFRHNQAGDLPGDKKQLSRDSVLRIALAASHLTGWTYTHYQPSRHNAHTVRVANRTGFTINFSCESIRQAKRLLKRGLAAVCVIHSKYANRESAKALRKKGVLICPATYLDATCARCKLCANPNRNYVIAFPSHGAGTKKTNEVIS